MTTDIALLGDIGAAGDLAEALGFRVNTGPQSVLPELKQLYKPVKGEMEHKGKKMTVETVAGGSYELVLPDGTSIYSETVTVRVFMQRYQYQRFEKFAVPVDGKTGKLYRTVMGKSFNDGDMKDNHGGFNCGRPSGYIKDYDSLAGPLRDIVKATKRVMVVMGLVTLDNPVDGNGNPVEVEGTYPFFMRVKNPNSYKAMDSIAKETAKKQRLPIQYLVRLASKYELLPNGEPNHWITTELLNPTDITLEDQQTVRDFMEWIDFNNKGILAAWDNAHRNDVDDDERDLVDQFISIGDSEDEEAA